MRFFLSVIFNLVICSFFLFPIGFRFLPSGLNTKVLMAVLGLLFVYRDINSSSKIPNYYLGVFVFGTIFSCVGLFSVFFNETTDYAYAGYLISMSVWLSSAYILALSVHRAHGYISFRLIVNYLLAVCLIQCLLALLIDNNLSFKLLVDTYILHVAGNTEFLNEVDRLYGIGAALDPAGVRFAAVLVLVAGVIVSYTRISRQALMLYAVAFLSLFALGNLISRTTTVGAFIGILLVLGHFIYTNLSKKQSSIRILGTFVASAILVFVLGFIVYINFEDMQGLIRYGFEAFFNYVEKGKFSTGSTDQLNTMWVFPDNLKTWIIGDGWFNDPYSNDWYMFTDIGYLRFIFYCGLVGLSFFTIFFIYVTYVLGQRYPEQKIVFYLLLLLGFAVWIKVSTDLFQFYALFLVVATMPHFIDENETENI